MHNEPDGPRGEEAEGAPLLTRGGAGSPPPGGGAKRLLRKLSAYTIKAEGKEDDGQHYLHEAGR